MADWQFWLLLIILVFWFFALRWGDNSEKLLRSIDDRFERLGLFIDREWPDLQSDISKLDNLETIIYRLNDVMRDLGAIRIKGIDLTPDVTKLLAEIQKHTNLGPELDLIIKRLDEVCSHSYQLDEIISRLKPEHTNQENQLDQIIALLDRLRIHVETVEAHVEGLRYRGEK